MTLGPIEVLVIGFPGNQFNGRILPEIQALIDGGVISVIDGLLIRKLSNGDVELVEFEDPGLEGHLAEFRDLVSETTYDLVAGDDVEEFAQALEPDSSAAVLVLEHTWSTPLRDAIVDSGGVLVANLRIPGAVVDEVLDSLAPA